MFLSIAEMAVRNHVVRERLDAIVLPPLRDIIVRYAGDMVMYDCFLNWDPTQLNGMIVDGPSGYYRWRVQQLPWFAGRARLFVERFEDDGSGTDRWIVMKTRYWSNAPDLWDWVCGKGVTDICGTLNGLVPLDEDANVVRRRLREVLKLQYMHHLVRIDVTAIGRARGHV